MEPNIYAPPNDEPLGPKEYQATVHVPSRSVPWGIRFATIIASVGSAALAVSGVILDFASRETAAHAAVGGVGISLTLTGHVLLLLFGGIIGLVVAVAVIAISTVTPVQHSRLLLPYLSAGIAPLLALAFLWCTFGGGVLSPPGLTELLFR